MNSLYPIITALLSTFLILISSICLRRMYWIREEKRRLMALGRRFDRYILKNGDTYLDTNNIPEWFKRYNRFKIHADVAKMPDQENREEKDSYE